MNMTLHQLKNYITGVLKGWLTNKATIDKFSESNSELLWGGEPIKAGASQVIRIREDISAKHSNPQTGSIVGNTKDSDGGGWLKRPITDYDEIIVSIKTENNIFYSEPVPVSRILAGRNSPPNDKNVITICSPFNPNVRFAVGWSDVGNSDIGVCSPEECDFLFLYDIPAGNSLQYMGIEGIKYVPVLNATGCYKETIFQNLSSGLNKTTNSGNGSNYFNRPITDFDEIRIAILGGNSSHSITYHTFDVADLVYCYKDAIASNKPMKICSRDASNAAQLVVWWDKDTPITGTKFNYTIEASTQYPMKVFKVEGIRYANIPADGDVNTAVTETIQTLNMEGENES